MTLRLESIKGVGWAAAERWSRVLFSFLVFALLARLLDPSAFGLVALAGLCTSLVEVFVSQGLGTALIQRRHLEAAHLDTVFWVSLVSGLALGLLTSLLAPVLTSLLAAPGLTPVLRVLSVTLPISALGIVPSAVLSRNMEFERLAIRSICAVVVGGIAGVATAWAGWGVWALVTQWVAGALAGVIALWVATPWRPGWQVTRTHFRELSRVGLALMGNNILWFFSRKGDEAVVGRGLGSTVLGAYSVANRLVATVLDLLASPIQAVAVPAMSRVQSDRQRLANAFVEGTILSAAM